ncbi:MAG: Uncharacterized protein G01um101420_614 [Parcubacteria group bacterium Gr01-1014_20]|nr:MAG: Uncharacterized protein G01um101420_614 [Parcubacteria group bacterium Gr01-1014_20]
MKKIFVGKNDSIAEVVEKILEEEDLEIVLVVPKNTILEESVSNFHLIKREASEAGKSILIESVDEGVLALAKASHIEAIHPLFKKRKRGSSLSDIVPMDEAGSPELTEDDLVRKPEVKSSKNRRLEEAYEASETKKSSRWFLRPAFLMVWLCVVLALVGYFWVASSFAKAEIFINFKETPWQHKGDVIAKAEINKISASENSLPAEVFTQAKNATELFPATGRASVKEKATGKIVIYNAYSSAKQGLVVDTRFLTPDNKIFRLTKSVTIPGAEIKEGKIIPSSIEADVAADQPGAEYNLGPVEGLSIPGFKGTPKYQAFYGSLVKATGGFIGEKSVPTEKDIAMAKEKTAELLKATLKNEFLNNRPKDFKIFDEAYEIKVTKISVNKSTDEKGNFQVTGEATLKGVAFREGDVTTYLKALASRDYEQSVFKDIKIDYSQIKADLVKGEIRFNLEVTANLVPEFSADSFKDQVIGRKIEDVRSLVLSLPGLDTARVSVWPVWVKKIPQNTAKIKINVD